MTSYKKFGELNIPLDEQYVSSPGGFSSIDHRQSGGFYGIGSSIGSDMAMQGGFYGQSGPLYDDPLIDAQLRVPSVAQDSEAEKPNTFSEIDKPISFAITQDFNSFFNKAAGLCLVIVGTAILGILSTDRSTGLQTGIARFFPIKNPELALLPGIMIIVGIYLLW